MKIDSSCDLQRLNFFEELEAAFDNGVESVDTAISSILQVQRDFNE